MRLVNHMLDKYVLVRSRDSGVWLGILKDAENTSVLLENARRSWSWTDAGECAALATIGPGGGNISPPSNLVVAGVCEIHEATDEAVRAWDAVPVWDGRSQDDQSLE